MRVAAHTLGCKLNFAETSFILSSFTSAGWEPVEFGDVADLYIINTCTVTAIAEKKCRNAIRQAIATNANAIVAVVGCFAHNNRSEIAKIDGVDIILDNSQKHELLRYVNDYQSSRGSVNSSGSTNSDNSFHIAYSLTDRTRSFLKIQDGCDYFCTYCAIPFARGRSRSATIDEVVAAAKKIASAGLKEVVLTGVNTGTFGLHNNESFLELLQHLDNVDGIERYRISSIEPNLLTDKIIDFVSHSSKFLPHFHIPLQAGSDKLLALMHRRYNTTFYSALLHNIKDKMPDACIAADIMAGFNGEDEKEFDLVKKYVESLPISYLHVFTFSERPRTAVLSFQDSIPIHQRREHSRQLQEISDRKKTEFYLSQQGTTHPVLWESTVKDGFIYGFTDNYIRVRQPSSLDNLKLINTVNLIQLNTFIENVEVYML